MRTISLEEFREVIQGSTGPIVDDDMIPIIDGQYLRIVSGKTSVEWFSGPMTFELWTPEDFAEVYGHLVANGGEL